MKEHCIKNLSEIHAVLASMTNEQFVESIEVLSGSSIGQHVRHILEFYICLLQGLEQGVINYDLRERNLNIESNLTYCKEELMKIQAQVDQCTENRNLVLEGNCKTDETGLFSIPTNLWRELSYNLEHAIHHQAIIKIGLNALDQQLDLAASFGVAPSTIRSKQTEHAMQSVS